jgi:hypothetical protein
LIELLSHCKERLIIESYDFGIIVINGKRYIDDVLIFPDRLKGNWWQKEGHKRASKDLQKVLKAESKALL